MEHEIPWTFPAIKKQVDSLEEAEVIDVDKDKMKWSIFIKPEIMPHIKGVILHYLTSDIKKIFDLYPGSIEKHYFGRIFGNTIDVDLVVIYRNLEKEQIDLMKEKINTLFKDFFIDTAAMVCMAAEEFEKRYKLADKFVLNLMRNIKN